MRADRVIIKVFFIDLKAPFRALGMTSSTIPNSAVTASSSHSSSYLPYKARLLWTFHGSTQSWCSYYQNVNQWLQIDLSLLEFVTAIATQGRYAVNQWVMSYWFSYSNDATSFNEYKDNQGRRKVRYIITYIIIIIINTILIIYIYYWRHIWLTSLLLLDFHW